MSTFFAKDIVVLDVTSGDIRGLVGCKKAQSVFNVKASVSRAYDGFADGEFFDPDAAARTAEDVLREVVQASGTTASRVFIGVPGEFAALVNRPVGITLDRVRKVIDADIDYLIAKGGKFDDRDYELVGSSPICFSVDTSDKLFFDVRGMNAGRVNATVSYMLAESSFTSLFAAAAKRAGFKETRFVVTPWAEGVTMFEREQRDASYVVLDVGYLSTSVAVGRGDGLLELRSFSMGGAHIAADIFEVLEVPYELAERASELVDLNLAYSDDAVLVADNEGIVHAAEACEIVRARLEYLAEVVSGVLDGTDIPGYAPVWLTGGGIDTMRGARAYLSEKLGRNVEICAPKLPGFDRTEDSSAVSLMFVAERLSKTSFGGYIKRVFNGGKR